MMGFAALYPSYRVDDTDEGIFLLIDVGGIGQKHIEIERVRGKFLQENGKASEIRFVDGTRKASASKKA